MVSTRQLEDGRYQIGAMTVSGTGMKTAVVLVIAILAQAAGNVILSKAMKNLALTNQVSGAGWLDIALQTGLHAMASPAVWFGTALLAVFFVLYAAALSWADLSFVLPATSFGYVLNVACGHYFLHETVTLSRWTGATVICIGVVLVSKSGVKSENGAGYG